MSGRLCAAGVVLVTVAFLAFFLAFHENSSKGANQAFEVQIDGSAKYANDKPVQGGQLCFTFVGINKKDYSIPVKANGSFMEKISFKKPPLMIKLQFIAQGVPPRTIEHLSGRDGQNINVVLYTNQQLNDADYSVLLKETANLNSLPYEFLAIKDRETKALFSKALDMELLQQRASILQSRLGIQAGKNIPNFFVENVRADLKGATDALKMIKK